MRWLLLPLMLFLLAAPGRCGERVDHAPFTALLRDVVQASAVNYAKLQGERGRLDDYLRALSRADLEKASREEQIAFFINGYNACVLSMVLRHYGKIGSIVEIRREFGYHPLRAPEWILARQRYSLDEIAVGVLGKTLDEPRALLALCCATRSAPALRNEAYAADKIDAQLEHAVRRFFENDANIKTEYEKPLFGAATPYLFVNELLGWHQNLFTPPGIPALASAYAKPDIGTFISAHSGKLTLRYLPYDWRLNDLPDGTGK